MALPQRRVVVRGIRIALAVAALVLLAVLFLTTGPSTWEALKRAQPLWLLAGAGFWGASVLLDGLRTSALARALGRRLPVGASVEMATSGVFLATVTPFQLSGLPYQLWLASKYKIEPGEGTAIIITRGLLIYLLLYAMLPFAVARFGADGGAVLKGALIYFGVVATLFTLVLLLSLTKPDLLAKLPLIRRKPKLVKGAVDQAAGMRNAFKAFFTARRPGPLLLALALSLPAQACYMLTVPCALAALGVTPDIWGALLLQAMLQGGLVYSPTPGAAGVAETAGYFLFASICPGPLVGVFVLLWRLYTAGLNAVVGGVLLFRRMAAG